MSHDWKEARIDRLTERVDRIEQTRREEKQRTLERWTYAMVATMWLTVGAAIAAAIARALS